MADDFEVPDEWCQLANAIDGSAEAVREYTRLDALPWPDSVASREKLRNSEFADIPFKHPAAHAVLSPLHFLGSAQDHLIAFAAILRTPRTVMALLTVMRTQLVGSAMAAYLGDPTIGLEERMRRVINVELDSQTEQMRLLIGVPGAAADFAALAERRKRLAAAAKKRPGWHVNQPESPKAKPWPKDWWIAPEPLPEGRLIDQLIGGLQSNDRSGVMLYRFLCATSHVQPHGLHGFIDKARAISRDDGSSLVTVGLDGRTVATLALLAIGGLTVALDKCARLYGWPVEPWAQRIKPLFDDLRRSLGIQTFTARDRHLLLG